MRYYYSICVSAILRFIITFEERGGMQPPQCIAVTRIKAVDHLLYIDGAEQIRIGCSQDAVTFRISPIRVVMLLSFVMEKRYKLRKLNRKCQFTPSFLVLI